MGSFLFVLFLIAAAIAGAWAAAWSFRLLGAAAIGPAIAGMAAGVCLVMVLILAVVILPIREDRRQPELNATEAAAVARAETMLQCRRRGGDAEWCDGYTPALLNRTCDHSWGIVLLSADSKVVRRVAVSRRGDYDGLSAGYDDPSPGESERLAKRPPGAPLIDDDLKSCARAALP